MHVAGLDAVENALADNTVLAALNTSNVNPAIAATTAPPMTTTDVSTLAGIVSTSNSNASITFSGDTNTKAGRQRTKPLTLSVS